jgi:Cys-rich four helix bundle protein (predicted Tat secretion target)
MLHRRDLLLGSLAAAAAMPVIAHAKPKDAPSAHEHAGHGDHAGHAAAASSPLLDAVMACHAAGLACQEHCLVELSSGNTAMAECMAAVVDMLPVCEATAALARRSSALLSSATPLCRAACEACRDACVDHVGHSDACRACHAACEAVLAAL